MNTNERSARKVRYLFVAIIVMVVAMLWWADGAQADEATLNQVEDWCEFGGVKLEPVDTPFIVPEGDWSLLVLKAGSDQSADTPNETFPDPIVGQAYTPSNGKDISHAILCYSPEEPSTTTTTSIPTSTTTTVTTPPTTTSTSTTTTTEPSTTTTETPTTTQPPPTSSIPPDTSPTTTAPSPCVPETGRSICELPYTGVGDWLGWAFVVGLIFLGGGLAMVLADWLARRYD